jgi:precorrin-2 dehydrogenase/sirohydrochlorin ferrochelatase
VAATDDRQVNAHVSADARRAGVLVSVVDAPRESDFIVPAVVRRGDLLIAISTSGRSPALAGHLRRELELLVPDDWEVLVRLLGAARTRVQRAVGDADRRRDLLERLASLDLLSTLRNDGRQAVTDQIDALITAMAATAAAPPQAAPSADETPTP